MSRFVFPRRLCLAAFVCTLASVASAQIAVEGKKVFTLAGPPTLIPRHIESLGCEVRYTLDELPSADVVYALRMQHERMSETWIPSIREYASWYQVNARRLQPHQLLMHPGPVNRGVELSGEVVDSPQAVITADNVKDFPNPPAFQK
jgi:aspartate carbamoyltransferase catalytic subunit